MKTLIRNAILLLCCLGFSLSAEPLSDKGKGLDTQVEDLKKAVIQLNRELFILEEELLFPGNTQVSIFLSLDIGNYFKLDSVQLHIDNKELTNHLYTEREVKALQRGVCNGSIWEISRQASMNWLPSSPGSVRREEITNGVRLSVSTKGSARNTWS